MSFWKNMLSKEGKVSSKRVVTFIAFLLMMLGFVIDLFTELEVSENIYESMQWIVMVGLGFTASEQFSPNGNNKTPKTPIKQEYDVGDEDV